MKVRVLENIVENGVQHHIGEIIEISAQRAKALGSSVAILKEVKPKKTEEEKGKSKGKEMKLAPKHRAIEKTETK